MAIEKADGVFGVDWDFGTTAQEGITALQTKIKEIPDHKKLAPPDRRMLSWNYDGVSLPLEDGSSIVIERSWYRPGDGYSGLTIEIGDATIKYPDDGFSVYYTPRIPVQLQIGKTVVTGEAISQLIMRDLPLPEQRIVLDWVKTSIEQGRLDKSPFSTTVQNSCLRAKPKS